eukprot:580912-Rhodomonas_salina.4
MGTSVRCSSGVAKRSARAVSTCAHRPSSQDNLVVITRAQTPLNSTRIETVGPMFNNARRPPTSK